MLQIKVFPESLSRKRNPVLSGEEAEGSIHLKPVKPELGSPRDNVEVGPKNYAVDQNQFCDDESW